MADLNLLFALLGGLVLALSLGAELLRSRSYVPSESMVATAIGVLLGPRGADVVRLGAWVDPMVLLGELARVTVAIAVASIALQLPRDYVRDRAGALATLVGPGMVVMWLVSSLLAYALIDIPVAAALLVGAIVTPTDPVIATSIVQGHTAVENIPKRLRFLISSKAGANDGVAYLFVFFALFLLGQTDDETLLSWTVATVGWELLGAVAVGLVAGAVVGRVERLLSRLDRLDETSKFTVAIALTVAVLGVAALLGTDDILAVFVAGLAYNWQADPGDEEREQTVEEVFNRLFTLPVFVAFGAAIPWAAWAALGWRGPALVVGILLLRRLPMVFALRPAIEPLDRPAATAFVGWFGPIGVAALFYAALAVHETGNGTPWILGSLVVAGSILAHGMTATAATYRYGGLDDDADWW